MAGRIGARVYRSKRWRRVRRAVFDRDGWRCTTCGRAGRLECDHVVPLHVDPNQDPFDPDGCRTLCRSCHVSVTAAQNRRPIAPARAALMALAMESAHA